MELMCVFPFQSNGNFLVGDNVCVMHYICVYLSIYIYIYSGIFVAVINLGNTEKFDGFILISLIPRRHSDEHRY